MKKIFTLTVIVLAGLVFCGKSDKKADKPDTNQQAAAPGEFGITRTLWSASATPQDRIAVAAAVKDAPVVLSGAEKATIQTNKGDIIAELYPNDAPGHVTNFVRLAESGYYDGLLWHRYAPGFVIQGGSPTNNSVGGTPYTVAFEKSPRKHEKGALGAARTPDPNSHNGQFYFTLAPQPGLDGDYVVFGKVIDGMDVVEKLRAMDTIVKISVTKGK